MFYYYLDIMFKFTSLYVYEVYLFLRYLICFFFSYSCVSCGKEVLYNNGFCSICWKKIDVLGVDICNICGKRDNIVCCTDQLILVEKTKICFRYAVKINHFTKELIHRFKYYDEYMIGDVFMRLLLKYIDNVEEYQYIIPVPMFFLKQIFRGYNPAYELSSFLQANMNNIKIINDLLYKSKNTISQTTLNYRQRKINLYNSFGVYLGDRIKGKKIILIDDIYTTGCTMRECIKCLLKYQPLRILCLSISYS